VRIRVDQKLFLSYLVLISLVVAALSVGADSLLRRHLVRLVEQDLRRELRLDTRLYDSLGELPPDSIADLLGGLSGHRVTIIRQDGVVVGESTRDGVELARMENHLHRPEVQDLIHGAAAEAARHSRTLGTDLLYMAARSQRGEIVRAALPLADIDRAVGGVQRGILGVGALAILLAGLFSLGFSVLVTRPLRRLQSAAAAMAGGDLTIRLRTGREDELGDLARLLDTLADELQRRLAQLEGERAETQALIDSMSEGVLALAADGTVRRANPAAQRMFSLREGWRAPRGLSAPGAAESVSRRPEFLGLVRRALGGETVSATELTSDGRALLATAHPLPQGGAVVVILDVSELRRLEGIRRDFVANASHELKTPLTAIRGYSETLADPDLSPELVQRFAGVVHANAERLQHIVDDLLDLTRIESGAWPITLAPVTLADLAEEVWSAQSRPAGEPAPAFVIDLTPGAERVLADAEALRQILTNLFSNALRYTPSGGTVTFAARVEAAGRVAVEVRDTGSGVESAHLPRLFERFYRADPARSRAQGGTGLGLAIVKHLVEAHGGRVEAESRVGSGTTIRFTLAAVPGDGLESQP
jgi:two-component system phosphate regulon sensor histidine kinase PhoR